MADISKITLLDGQEYDIKDAVARAAIPAAATATPKMDGSAAVGTSTKYAKEDHRHPRDTSLFFLECEGTSIALNTDLNDLRTPGNYYCSSISTAPTILNCPPQKDIYNPFKLAVIEASSAYWMFMQLMIVGPGESIYCRFYYGGDWHDWFDMCSPTTVNGHTVESDVPANAVFTDTTYTPASATPLMDGTAAVGTSENYAREDHVHPKDSSMLVLDQFGTEFASGDDLDDFITPGNYYTNDAYVPQSLLHRPSQVSNQAFPCKLIVLKVGRANSGNPILYQFYLGGVFSDATIYMRSRATEMVWTEWVCFTEPTTVNGHTVLSDVPANAVFTDTTYTPASAAPGNVASSSSTGTSINYARQDHTHGIDLATGDSNGQVKIAGQNVSVKGLGSLAYADSVTTVNGHTVQSDVPANAVFTDTTYTPASANPLMDGTAAVGTSTKYAREDHVHPISTGYCSTPSGTGIKVISSPGLVLKDPCWFFVTFENANTYEGQIYLNVNGTGNHLLFINGKSSHSTNYSFPAGTYLIYYHSSFYLNTYGDLPVDQLPIVTCYGFSSVGVKSINLNNRFAQEILGSPGFLFFVYFAEANSYTGKLYFSVTNSANNSTYNIPIYINGEISSETNCRIPSGLYPACRKDNGIYIQTNGKIPIDIVGTVNGYNVLSDVPANAVFTDTTYTPASANPLMDGTAAVGTSTKYAREDHVHPRDSKVAALEYNVTEINTGDDLDDYITPGTYYCATATIASNVSNVPEGVGAAFKLYVIGIIQNRYYQLLLFNNDAHLMFYRYYYDGSWFSWHEVDNPSKVNGHTVLSNVPANLAFNCLYYGECSTAAATVAKTVTLTNGDGFSLVEGAKICVRFEYANSASSPTLNVNDTGAKAIVRFGTTVIGTTAGGTGNWSNGGMVLFIYDGTSWVEHYWNNTTYSSMTVAEYTAGTATTGRLMTAARLKAAIKLHSAPDVYTATIPTTGWTTASYGAYIDVTFTGATFAADDTVFVDLNLSSDTNLQLINDSWACLLRATPTASSAIIRFKFREIPTVAIPVRAVVK